MLTGVWNIARAARSPMLASRSRFRAAGGYAQVWIDARLPRRRSARTVDVGGWRITYEDANSLLVLLDDIALRRDYAFVPRTDRPVIVDAGANIGIATLAFKRLAPRARVVAIEPSPQAHALLVQNVEQNGLDDVTVHHAALAAEEGVVALRLGESDTSLRSRVDAGGTVHVPGVRLSQLVGEPIDFLKLDVEGSEEDVLTELAQAGRLSDVRELVLEYHHHLDGRPDRLSVVLSLLEEHGFTYQVSVPRPRLAEIGEFTDVLIRAVHVR